MVRKLLLFLASFSIVYGHEDAAKISEAVGHLIGKNLQSLGLEIDIDALVKGLSDEASGKASPMGEEECVEAIATLQEEGFTKLAERNLQEANQFLQRNREKKGIVSIAEGKLQYEVLKKGEGEAVHSYNSPLVHLSGKLLSGESIGEIEEVLTLDETIEGFSKGLIGMQEGEKRVLYIHPDLGYGKEESFQPNSLLIFEVELLKADASLDSKSVSDQEMDLVAPEPVIEPSK